MKFSQHSWFHLSALNCTVFYLVPVSLPLNSTDTFSHSRIWLWSVSYFPMGNGDKDEYIFKKQNTCKKQNKEACMFSTVCTRYIHVALAAYVPMLWERFTFGHSCNYSVVLSKNVSTWNKKTFGYFFIYIPWGNAVWYSCLTLRKLLHLNCLEKYLIYFIPPHTWTSISTMKSVWSFGFVEYHNLPEKQMCLVSVFFPPFFALIEIQHGFPLWSKWAQKKNIYIYISELHGWFLENEPLDLNSWEACFSLTIINKKKNLQILNASTDNSAVFATLTWPLYYYKKSLSPTLR